VVHYYDLDITGIILSCNAAQAYHYGFSSVQDIIGRSLQEFMPFEHVERIIQNNNLVIHAEQPKLFVEPYLLLNHRFLALSYKAPLYARNQSKILGITGHSFILDEADTAPARRLSAQQINCIVCLIQGMTIKQIAVALCLSDCTVKHYLEQAKAKLHCVNRTQFITASLKHPLIAEQVLFWPEIKNTLF
jgi:DNA-binding CsgD family transcriptional regulator